MTTRRLVFSLFAAATLVLGVVNTVFGTPPSNIVSAPVLARGQFTDRVDAKFKVATNWGVHVADVQGAGEVVVQQITLGPGGSTGWHSHPGPVVVVIQSGSFLLKHVDHGTCIEQRFAAGDAFVDHGQGRVHIGLNPSTTTSVTLYATYFDVATAGAFRLDAAAPAGC